MAVRKGLPFLDKINSVLFQIVEHGLVSKWLYESQVNINKTMIPYYEDTQRHLDLDRIFSAIALLVVGFVASIFVFLLEVLCAKIYS